MNLLSDRIELPASVVSEIDVSMLGRLWRPLLAAGTEGGHGFDLNAVQRPLTGQGFCSINTSRPSFGCQP